MKKLIFFVLLACILSINFADAYTSADIYINQDGSAVFIGRADKPLGIGGIEFDKGKIYGVTQELTTKNAEIWTFSLSLKDTSELKIYLPENSVLITNTLNSNVETQIEDYKESIAIMLSGNNPFITFNYKISPKQNKLWIWIIVIVILIVITATVIIFIKRKKTKKKIIKKKKQKKIDIIKKTLNEREQKIIELLLQNKKVKQSFLQKKTEIPKASFSRHVHNLEKKNIIEKIGQGKNNILKLKKEMLKKA